jgi:hypothetical protein
MRALRLANFLRAHAPEEIILLVELAHMVEAQPAPLRWPIGGMAHILRRGAEFSCISATVHQAPTHVSPGYPAVKPLMPPRLFLIRQNNSPL